MGFPCYILISDNKRKEFPNCRIGGIGIPKTVKRFFNASPEEIPSTEEVSVIEVKNYGIFGKHYDNYVFFEFDTCHGWMTFERFTTDFCALQCKKIIVKMIREMTDEEVDYFFETEVEAR